MDLNPSLISSSNSCGKPQLTHFGFIEARPFKMYLICPYLAYIVSTADLSLHGLHNVCVEHRLEGPIIVGIAIRCCRSISMHFSIAVLVERLGHSSHCEVLHRVRAKIDTAERRRESLRVRGTQPGMMIFLGRWSSARGKGRPIAHFIPPVSCLVPCGAEKIRQKSVCLFRIMHKKTKKICLLKLVHLSLSRALRNSAETCEFELCDGSIAFRFSCVWDK